MIYWIGNSENWDKPIHPTAGISPFYTFPLVEETVLETAFSPLYSAYKRLSKGAALNCTSRYAMRSVLPRELNPYWQKMPNFGDGLVVKAPASCQNQGVGFALPNEYSRRLTLYSAYNSSVGVVEQYIPGPQYEADGIVIEGKVHLLAWTLQEGENGKIVRYSPCARFNNEASRAVIETVVKALGLDNCPFCFEMKPEKGQWKIIDAHARLGEDRRLWTNQEELFSRIDRIISG